MSIVGRTYLEHGEPVEIIAQWRGKASALMYGSEVSVVYVEQPEPKGGPRNVLIRRADGTLVVRPFRGLRKASGSA